MRGARLTASAPFGGCGTQTLVAGLTHPGMIAHLGHQGRNAFRDLRFAHALPVTDGPAFAAYVREVLIPAINPGAAVVLDTLVSHRNRQAEAALHAQDAGAFACCDTAVTSTPSDWHFQS